MWFPSVPKVRMRLEEFLVRLEITEAVILRTAERLNVESSIFGRLKELDELRQKCADVHQILGGALDGLCSGAVTPRQLADRIPKVENEVTYLEMVADQIAKSLDVMEASECS